MQVGVPSMTAIDLKDKKATTQLNTGPRTDHDRGRGYDLSSDEQVVLEPLDGNLYYLSYACLMIPRFHSHSLSGDIALLLPERLQHICIAFGWRLEFTSIKADHFQWILKVPPATSPAHFMKTIRQHTSDFIFHEFPRFKRENLSRDFWAPGYLIYLGTEPISMDIIHAFIQQTRRQQGNFPNG